MDTNLLLTKLEIANNKAFVKSIIEKADVQSGDKVAVAYWCSPVVFETVKNMFPEADVYYIEDKSIAGLYNIKNAIFTDIDNKEYFPDMQFDKVIMNPPYEKNMHLKVLAEVMNHITAKGEIINLSPIRWLQDPLAPYKNNSDYYKYEDCISKHIESVDILDREKAAKLFSIRQNTDLGIYKIKIIREYNLYKSLFNNSIVDKVVNELEDTLYNHIEYNISSGWRVRVSDLKPLNAGSNGEGTTAGYYNKFELLHRSKSWVYHNGMQNGKHWSWYNGKTGCKIYTEDDELPRSLKFNTKNEAFNFEASTKTTFYRYILASMKFDQHTPFKFLPYMGDYTQPWIDERFYEYFGITKAEQKIIEEVMAQYETK